MDAKEAIKLLEKSAFNSKSLEQSKVLFYHRMLAAPGSGNASHSNSNATIMHEELAKLPMLVRKALEADFNLFHKLSDRELLTTDMLHKHSWCQLIWTVFASMDSKTSSVWDIALFLSIVNGSFILHCEDMSMVRTCLATYINASRHFQQIFATHGYKCKPKTKCQI